jgi:MSHA biogenesis protein MshI
MKTQSEKQFGRRAADSFRTGLVGISTTQNGIALAYSDSKKAAGTIQACSFTNAEDLAHKQTAIIKFVAEHNLEGLGCSYVLSPIPGEYTITMIESPRVPPEELAQAMKWHIRELISFPVEEAIIEAFELPYARARDNMKMAYAVVIRRSMLNDIEKIIRNVGLHLAVIDIPEMALRNLINFYPKSDKGNIVLQLYPNGGKIIWYRDGMLCIARTIELDLKALAVAGAAPQTSIMEAIALEIQRSLDYISSVFRQEPPSSILLAPTLLNISPIEQFLKGNLTSEIVNLDLKNILKFKDNIEVNQANVLLAVGGSLREEG